MSRLVAALLAAGLLSAWVGAADDGVLEAGRDVPPPATRKVVEPTYPPEAAAAGVGGIVIVEIIIDEEGNVASARTLRSVPGLDKAALAAVRQWKYEATRVDGQPVRVRQVVPITFSRRLPPMLRQQGIPELRQGATPAMVQPEGVGGVVPIEATVEVTLAPDGSVDSVDRRGVTNPWTDSLAAAVREWRFAPGNADERIAFRVVAKFVSRAGGGPRVDLELTGLHVTSLEPQSSEPAATAASSDAGPKPAAPAATPTPEAQAPSEAAEPRSVPAVDVVSAPVIPPPPPPEPAMAGSSAVARVSLGVGVPDLVSGRQPIVPPMARLNGVTGRVDVVFSLDAAGRATVESSEGPEALKPQAEGAVGSWAFRRTTVARLFLVAHFEYTDAGASASVAVRAPEPPTEPDASGPTDQAGETAPTSGTAQAKQPAQTEQPAQAEQP
jgi:TonB family protein